MCLLWIFLASNTYANPMLTISSKHYSNCIKSPQIGQAESSPALTYSGTTSSAPPKQSWKDDTSPTSTQGLTILTPRNLSTCHTNTGQSSMELRSNMPTMKAPSWMTRTQNEYKASLVLSYTTHAPWTIKYCSLSTPLEYNRQPRQRTRSRRLTNS